jgi:hypothetical protein
VEEFAVEDQDLPLFRREEESFQGSGQEGLTDFGVPESEPSGLGAEEEMARLFEAALAEQMAGESGAENAADDSSDLSLEKMIAEELAAENEAETVADDLSDLSLEKMIAEELAAESEAETAADVLSEQDLERMIAEELAADAEAETTPAVLTDAPLGGEPTAGAALDHLMEAEALVATQIEEPEMESVAAEAPVPLEPRSEPRVEPDEAVIAGAAAEIVSSFADEGPFTLVEQVEAPMDQVPASGTCDVLVLAAEPLFSITAISTMARDAMTIEEEILFAYRPAEEAPEVGGQSGFAGAVAEDLQVPAVDSESGEVIETEPTFSLDTYFPVTEGEPPICTAGMDLLELVTHMETTLLGNLQDLVEPRLSEMMRGAVKDELEGLRRLIDHIEEVEDLRL